MVERDAKGDEEDNPLKLKIVKPRKKPARRRAEPEKVGVGAKKGDDDDSADSGDSDSTSEDSK